MQPTTLNVYPADGETETMYNAMTDIYKCQTKKNVRDMSILIFPKKSSLKYRRV